VDSKMLEFVKKHVYSDVEAILSDDGSEDRAGLNTKSDAAYFEEAAAKCKNPDMILFLALRKVEQTRSEENIRAVVCAAKEVDDFVTALYWHQKLNLGRTDIDGRFERMGCESMAKVQRREDPSARPITASEQMIVHRTKTAHELGSRDYLETEVRVKELQHKIYMEEIEAIEKSVLQPAQKKVAKESDANVWLGLVELGVALAWLIYSTPKVWAWCEDFFFRKLSLLAGFFWLVPIAYVIFVVILALVILTNTGKEKESKKVKAALGEQARKARMRVEKTAEWEQLQQMKKGIGGECKSYGERLVYAVLSAMYGKEDVSRSRWDSPAEATWGYDGLWAKKVTWLTRDAAVSHTDGTYYRDKILSLMDEGNSDGELFLAVELFRKETAQPEYVKKLGTLRRFAGDVAGMNQSAKPYKKQAHVLFDMIYGFLQAEYRAAKLSRDDAYLGEACFQLYDVIGCSGSFLNNSGQLIWDYGREGLGKSDKLMWKVMHNAIYKVYHGSPYTLGYTRAGVTEYINDLKRKGDARWQEMKRDLDAAVNAEIREAADAREAREITQKQEQWMKERMEAKRRAELEDEYDAAERDANMWRSGDYSTDEERMVAGKISYQDYADSEERRQKAIQKKLDEGQ